MSIKDVDSKAAEPFPPWDRVGNPWHYAVFASVLVAFALAVLFIDPFQETAMEDDWAYALTVRELAATGHYHLHEWLSANMPFQAYWGAAWAKLLGFSFATLRISTVALVFMGLAAFFFLAREHEFSPSRAGLLTLGLIACPLVLRFGLNFMTDVPFLMLLTIALYFYTRAPRLRNYPLMALAAVTATAAILTRQFGMALVAGVAVQWVLRKNRWRDLVFYLTGVAMPAAASCWQLFMGFYHPGWFADVNKRSQSLFFESGAVLADFPWRITLVLQYMALFALPLVLICLLKFGFFLARPMRKSYFAVLMFSGLALTLVAARSAAIREANPDSFLGEMLLGVSGMTLLVGSGWLLLRSPQFEQNPALAEKNTTPRFDVLTLGLLGAALGAGILYGHGPGREHLLRFMGASQFEGKELSDWWYVPVLPWNLEALQSMGRLARAALTVLTAVGAALFGRVIVLRLRGYFQAGTFTPRVPLLDLVTFFYLIQTLIYCHIGDEYLTALIPFTLIAVGRYLGEWLKRFQALLAISFLLILAASAVWTRGLLAEKEAFWRAGESLRTAGISPKEINASWEWNCYQGAFDEYVAEVRDQKFTTIDDFFLRWQREREAEASYLILREPALPPTDNEEWEALGNFSFRDGFSKERYVGIWRKKGLTMRSMKQGEGD